MQVCWSSGDRRFPGVRAATSQPGCPYQLEVGFAHRLLRDDPGCEVAAGTPGNRRSPDDQQTCIAVPAARWGHLKNGAYLFAAVPATRWGLTPGSVVADEHLVFTPSVLSTLGPGPGIHCSAAFRSGAGHGMALQLVFGATFGCVLHNVSSPARWDGSRG